MTKWRRKKSLPRRWQRAHLVQKYDSTCCVCNNKIQTMKQVTIDHWVPLSKGGQDVLENYRIAHYACNQLKANLTPEEFNLFQDGLIQWE